MFFCGNDEGAKADTARLIGQFGWEACDMGTAKAARLVAVRRVARLELPGHAFSMV